MRLQVKFRIQFSNGESETLVRVANSIIEAWKQLLSALEPKQGIGKARTIREINSISILSVSELSDNF